MNKYVDFRIKIILVDIIITNQYEHMLFRLHILTLW